MARLTTIIDSRGQSEALSVRVTEGVFTYVAIDAERKPRPLP